MDSRIVILFGAHVGRGMLTHMLQENDIPQVELLDFLLEKPHQENMLADIGIYAVELMLPPQEEHLLADVPVLVERQHYRDLEYRGGRRRSQLLRSRAPQKGRMK